MGIVVSEVCFGRCRGAMADRSKGDIPHVHSQEPQRPPRTIPRTRSRAYLREGTTFVDSIENYLSKGTHLSPAKPETFQEAEAQLSYFRE